MAFKWYFVIHTTILFLEIDFQIIQIPLFTGYTRPKIFLKKNQKKSTTFEKVMLYIVFLVILRLLRYLLLSSQHVDQQP